MDLTRRGIMAGGAGALALGAAGTGRAREACLPAPAPSRPRTGIEGQRVADNGDGTFLNPVLSGDRPDPTVLRDGEDYYATFSPFDYYPAIVIWHSRDLVNWRPLGPALTRPIGSIYALDLVKHDDRYFIYMPVVRNDAKEGEHRLSIQVIHAPSCEGPWSDPIDMGIYTGIDPGHIVGEDGKRYLFLSDGQLVPISDDGLSRAGPTETVYSGWPIPENWSIEATALEGPKLIRRGDWFYMFSAQGGTAGPPTSHMVVVARSRSVRGPWENCPHNPIVRTASRHEPWWSRGHATPLEAPDGSWWLVYHGYEKEFRTLGRQMLLEPFAWDEDGWPRTLGKDLGAALKKPDPRSRPMPNLALSDDFTKSAFGTRLAFYKPGPDYLDRVRLDDGALILTGQGTGPADCSPLAFIAGDTSYEVTVALRRKEAASGGLLLFYNDALFCGLDWNGKDIGVHYIGRKMYYPMKADWSAETIHLRLVNRRNVVDFFRSNDGRTWHRHVSLDVSGYHHNMAGDFISLRPALFACGAGTVEFRSLQYRGLADD